LALPLPVQVRDRGGGGVTGIVPALERGHHDRVDQLGNPLELDHPAPPSDVPSRTPQPYGVPSGLPQPPDKGSAPITAPPDTGKHPVPDRGAGPAFTAAAPG